MDTDDVIKRIKEQSLLGVSISYSSRCQRCGAIMSPDQPSTNEHRHGVTELFETYCLPCVRALVGEK